MKRKFTVRTENKKNCVEITVLRRGNSIGALTVSIDDADELIGLICGGVNVRQQAEIVTGTMVGAVIGNLGG